MEQKVSSDREISVELPAIRWSVLFDDRDGIKDIL
jgi:hypothetical protein